MNDVANPDIRTPGLFLIMREAFVSARASPLSSIITALLTAGMVVAVILTSGRTVGAEQSVVATIDSAGTRSIVFRADAGAGVEASVLSRLENMGGIEWAGAFGPSVDAQNSAFSDGTSVPSREAWSADWAELGLRNPDTGGGDVAYTSRDAMTRLGMTVPFGSIQTTDDRRLSVGGRLDVPDQIKFLEPLVVVPQPLGQDQTISILVVVAERPDLVVPLAEAISSVMDPTDASAVTVQTSENFAALRAVIEGQLSTFGKGLTLAILALTSVLNAAVMFAFVMLRRKEFGRRRALGASQAFIVGLLLAQTGIIAIAATIAGSAVALVILRAAEDPIPDPSWIASIGILAVLVAGLAGLLPAVVASRREPLRELRVP